MRSSLFTVTILICCVIVSSHSSAATFVTFPPTSTTALSVPRAALKCFVGIAIGMMQAALVGAKESLTPKLTVKNQTSKEYKILNLGSKNQYVHGILMDCTGECFNTTISIHNSPATIFLCDPHQFCSYMLNHNISTDNICHHVVKGTSTCCCSYGSNCNIRNNVWKKATQVPTVSPNNHAQHNKSCFIGISFESTVEFNDPNSDNVTIIPPNLPVGRFYPCMGQCANISLGRFGTLYSCDPITICESFKMENKCNQIDNLLSGCCCSTDRCNMFRMKAEMVETTVETTTGSAEGFKRFSLTLLVLQIVVWFPE